MNQLEFETAPAPQRPKTAVVVGLLAAVAATISYLASYAMANALVSAEVLKPWPSDHDPRPKWFVMGFVVLASAFLVIGVVARQMSARLLEPFRIILHLHETSPEELSRQLEIQHQAFARRLVFACQRVALKLLGRERVGG